ncbi:MAG: SMC-Scp complex subunit ScpB [Planctomycetaceae bacterium]
MQSEELSDFDSDENDVDPSESEFAIEDIELAYRQALAALDEAERQVGSVMVDFVEPAPISEETGVTDGLSIGAQLAEDLKTTAAQTQATEQSVLVEGIRRVTPREVIEASLFVGGDVALTARRLASLIGQDVDNRVAVSLIDSLNQTYARENRPYEIRLHEGGYRLELREEYSDILTRTFGLGPREVKLSPETLEVLAFVAWNQPVDNDKLSTIDKPGAMTQLRQLLRLQLIEIKRTGSKRADICYVTTPRFLKLFGLQSIEDLPTADVFSFK